mmetsp:Transcript_17423/g.52244  ORF Transcript_17423/g.52244 Transcript_17423/m.52244 type:complete len:223 (+) Transcript_17423:2011-2679(+)
MLFLGEPMVRAFHDSQRVVLHAMVELRSVRHRYGVIGCSMERQHTGLLDRFRCRLHIRSQSLVHILLSEGGRGAGAWMGHLQAASPHELLPGLGAEPCIEALQEMESTTYVHYAEAVRVVLGAIEYHFSAAFGVTQHSEHLLPFVPQKLSSRLHLPYLITVVCKLEGALRLPVAAKVKSNRPHTTLSQPLGNACQVESVLAAGVAVLQDHRMRRLRQRVKTH